MKYLVKTLALATAIAAFSSPSMAADDDIDILLAPESTFVEVGSGWYLRGDITASLNGSRIFSNRSETIGSPPQLEESDTEFRDMIGFGIGAGYRFTNNFRVDMNLGHYLSGESANFRQLTLAEKGTNPSIETDTNLTPLDPTADGRCGGLYKDSDGNVFPKFIENCSTSDEATYNTFALVGSGYYDLPSFGKFQPFVGAGVGVARVRWQENIGSTICTPRHADANPESCNGQSGDDQPGLNEVYKYGGVQSGGIDYRMAYALTAGFGYRINDHLILDASYKFLGVGNTMGISGGSGKAQSVAKNGFGLHQVVFGVRYEIW